MGFLDVEIPDWLKPPSPADQAKARSQAMQTGLQIGAQAYQNQLQREHSWDMEKMRLAQGMDEFKQKLDFDKERWVIDKQLKDIAIQDARKELNNQPTVVKYVKLFGEMNDPDLIASYPVEGDLDPKSMSIIEQFRNNRVAVTSKLREQSDAYQARKGFRDLAKTEGRYNPVAAAKILGILNENPDYLGPDAVDKIQSEVQRLNDSKLKWELDSKLAVERERQLNHNPGPVRLWPIEKSDAYREAIKGKTIDEIRAINKVFGADMFDEGSAPQSNPESKPSSGLMKSIQDWMATNPELAARLARAGVTAANPIAGSALDILNALTDTAKKLPPTEQIPPVNPAPLQGIPTVNQVQPKKTKKVFDPKTGHVIIQPE